MIFFRSRVQKIVLKKNLGLPQGFFVSVQVRLKGEIEPLSGMVKNLVEVDKAFDLIFRVDRVHQNFRSFCLFVFAEFKKKWGTSIYELRVSFGARTLIFDGKKMRCETRFQTYFNENGVVTLRRVRLKSSHFNSALLFKTRAAIWNSPQDCLVSLQKHWKKPISLEVERPEIRAWLKWQSR